MSEIAKLEKITGVKFKDKDLLQMSVVHRSYLNEHPEYQHDHNERLEFLGDAVLELVVTEYLFNNFSNPEGELTNWRAALVNAKMLAKIGRDLGVEQFMMMSKGEAKDVNSKAREYILANAMEAIIGAIYLDKGYKASQAFIMKNVVKELPAILEGKTYVDAKSKFQEISQREFSITPTYKVLSESGPDHAKVFEVGVYIKKDLVASGRGTSKQEAELEAASKALKTKGWE